MEYFFRFEQPWWLFILVPLVLVLIFLRRWWAVSVIYRHALVTTLKKKNYTSRHPFQTIFYCIRLASLIGLALLIAKPQFVDSRSNMLVEGIDIILTLDVSGSMQFQDFSDDKRSRFEVAKEEAIRFIHKRTNDALGLVLFGRDAISRCPLTHDKKILQELVGNLNLGDIDPDGTMLATGLITAINRLKNSQAKSKVIILLTDGEPSEGDMDPQAACEIAKKFNIKVYTIGIGSEKEEVFVHPLYGLVAKPKVNTGLLKRIARETGGSFFMAHNAQDMRAIYDTIDQLEKTKHESPLYSRYYDIYTSWSLVIFAILISQILLSTFIWFTI